ncbi:glycerophosphodiester phosphodiesterase [Candidatus Vecturithrix granuli]|uniref:glycerophosphodiester phosphodiesterase n=1 Tax=Vecturithrix granuli TaxID=1499967 RepID=A0A081BX38_VECG1|nr:glycerophosphodiester phosphodiesterase [Candidatus Vecturithrix granuli]
MKKKYVWYILIIIAVLCCALNLNVPVQAQHTNSQKMIIAHRGASGYLPEHTLEAVAMAYALGADFIEQDVVLTRDGTPVVLHDIYLDLTTNVREIFPHRARPDGRWYVIDFTLAEIKTLQVSERVQPGTRMVVFPTRFPVGKSDFEIPTLAEEIELIQGLNTSTGRNVGIYPELKQPAFHTREGYDIGKIVLDMLAEYGYEGPEANVYVQCFEPDYTQRLRQELGTKLPLVQLIGAGRVYDVLVTAAGLDLIASYANGIGPALSRIVSEKAGNARKISELVTQAHKRGLVVHPYTFRQDELPPYIQNFDELIRLFFFDIGVDGGFTDFPDRMKNAFSQR